MQGSKTETQRALDGAGGKVDALAQRVEATGLLRRTTLGALLVLCMAADLVLLHEPGVHLPITIVQSVLWLLVLFVAVRTELPARVRARVSRRARSRTWLALGGVASIASLALFEKLWIALRSDLAVRLSYASSYRVMGAALTLAGLVLMLGHGRRIARYFAALAEHPARQIALSFLGLSVFGGFLLSLPVCVREPAHVSFVDSLFMATSAVCVTGLAVNGIATEYTTTGQVVLLGLVQTGGLGIMVLSASMVVLTGRKLRARSSAVLAEVLDAESVASLRGSIRRIVLFTLALEAMGAMVLYAAFAAHPAVAWGTEASHPMAGAGSALWAAVFHAVSAFCNAGFSLAHDGLVPFADSHGVCTVIMVLIVLGGLGFPVLSELLAQLQARIARRRPLRLSLHTRVVLTLSAVLIGSGTAALAALEWRGALAERPWTEQVFTALFQAVTLRTAGFNTVSVASFGNASLMVCMLLMLVGASPGGTGGGIKTTTMAVLYATLRAELRGAEDPALFDRRLPAGTVRRAISVAFVSVIIMTVVVLLLLLTEDAEPIRIAFEAASAFATVGLTVDLTPSLSSAGKIIIIAAMLIGRVGPLTVALAASERQRRAHHQPPHERVLIG